MKAYFDCYSGASGDMILGALLDAGLELEALQQQLATLGLEGYELSAEPVVSKGISGTRANVRLTRHEHAHRGLTDILRIVNGSGLSSEAKTRISRIFTRLAQAEAKVHGVSTEEIHFHEVGAVDAIVDICGAVVGLELLGVDEFYCSPLASGTGTTTCAHGVIPVPAPATLELIKDSEATLKYLKVEAETLTPTGAAILTTLCRFEQPTMTIDRLGYGFGGRQLPWANALRLWIEADLAGDQGALERDEVVVMETNLDDCSGELIGYAMNRLLEAGALDVYLTSIQMKKSRPGTMLSVIARPEQVPALVELVLTETSSLGMRLSPRERIKCTRSVTEVETKYGRLKAKVKQLGEKRILSPEFEDAARAARQHNVSLGEVYRAITCSEDS